MTDQTPVNLYQAIRNRFSFTPMTKGQDPTVKPVDRLTPNSFTPQRERPDVAAISSKADPGMLPATAAVPAQGGLSTYLASQGAKGRTMNTLFHPLPPTGAQFPRAADSQNIAAVPPRNLGTVAYKIFSKPRAGTPGYNPGGVNTTATP